MHGKIDELVIMLFEWSKFCKIINVKLNNNEKGDTSQSMRLQNALLAKIIIYTQHNNYTSLTAHDWINHIWIPLHSCLSLSLYSPRPVKLHQSPSLSSALAARDMSPQKNMMTSSVAHMSCVRIVQTKEPVLNIHGQRKELLDSDNNWKL